MNEDICLKVSVPHLIYQVVLKTRISLGQANVIKGPVVVQFNDIIADYNDDTKGLCNNNQLSMNFVHNNNITIFDLPRIVIGNRSIVSYRNYRTSLQNIKIILQGICNKLLVYDDDIYLYPTNEELLYAKEQYYNRINNSNDGLLTCLIEYLIYSINQYGYNITVDIDKHIQYNNNHNSISTCYGYIKFPINTTELKYYEKQKRRRKENNTFVPLKFDDTTDIGEIIEQIVIEIWEVLATSTSIVDNNVTTTSSSTITSNDLNITLGIGSLLLSTSIVVNDNDVQHHIHRTILSLYKSEMTDNNDDVVPFIAISISIGNATTMIEELCKMLYTNTDDCNYLDINIRPDSQLTKNDDTYVNIVDGDENNDNNSNIDTDNNINNTNNIDMNHKEVKASAVKARRYKVPLEEDNDDNNIYCTNVDECQTWRDLDMSKGICLSRLLPYLTDHDSIKDFLHHYKANNNTNSNANIHTNNSITINDDTTEANNDIIDIEEDNVIMSQWDDNENDQYNEDHYMLNQYNDESDDDNDND